MNSADQVVFVLQLTLALGPLAVYFLGLGLVNSQAHSRLIKARTDFVLLAVVFLPLIVAPAIFLIRQGWLLAALGVVLVVGGLFRAMLPARSGAWVIYNIDPDQFRSLLQSACHRLGWSPSWKDDHVHILPPGLIIRQDEVLLLRNITIRIESTGTAPAASDQQRFIQALKGETQQIPMLPSPAGASLVVIGAALLGTPLWYVFQNLEAIVDVVRQIFFA